VTSPSPAFEFRDLKPGTGSFLNDVVQGLSAPRKTLPPKYFYDERGSHLFEAICELPEYYPTRTELAMLEAAAPDIAHRVGAGSAIVEYGSGAGTKPRLLVRALQPRVYVAVDIAGEQLRSAVGALAREFPNVRMVAICADYTHALPLGDIDKSDVSRRVVFFPGSTIGNFDPPEALAFLTNACTVAGRGGAMLIGVDLKKDERVLHAAYNDAAGITAAFNLNVLTRINRELEGDFDLDGFEHRAHYDANAGRIEMHLVSRRAQRVRVAGREFAFAAGETIHTENSYKYSIDEFQALAARAGFGAEHCWVDPQRLFSIHYLTVPGARVG
jgi:L-histidine Nalpha-methyltransferase